MISSNSSLKSSLSVLFLRTLDQLEEPKYATVPVMHCEETRPSILRKYRDDEDTESYHESRHELKICDSIYTIETEQPQVSRNCICKQKSVRSLVKPLWKYCTSKIHLGSERKRVDFGNLRKQNKGANFSPKTNAFLMQTSSQTPKTSIMKEKSKWKRCDESPRHPHSSLPAFEVLPSLYENRNHSLLYQNSYLLDGVKYDYGPGRQAPRHDVRTKLRLNYLKFFKSVNRNQKPTDREVIFGEAKVIVNPPPRWENSRIDWLLNLERNQELRKLQKLEQQQQLKDTYKISEILKANEEKERKQNNKKPKRMKNGFEERLKQQEDRKIPIENNESCSYSLWRRVKMFEKSKLKAQNSSESSQ